MEVSLVQVRLLENQKVLFRSPGTLEVQKGDICTVESREGELLAEVLTRPWRSEIERERGNAQPLFRVLRKAHPEEVDIWFREREFEREARAVLLEAVKRHELPMKFVQVEHRHSPAKTVFSFTSEGRVDFRDLVKDLAGALKVRVEMKQVGVRDEARHLGAVARCGQETCCSRFLTDFAPVSIKMAKNQDLSLIPSKISGQCGRLLCCLAYENDHYREARKQLPKNGDFVNTAAGPGRVMNVDYLRFRVRVRFVVGSDTTFEVAEVAKIPRNEYEAMVQTVLDAQPVRQQSAPRQSRYERALENASRRQREAAEATNADSEEAVELQDGGDYGGEETDADLDQGYAEVDSDADGGDEQADGESEDGAARREARREAGRSERPHRERDDRRRGFRERDRDRDRDRDRPRRSESEQANAEAAGGDNSAEQGGERDERRRRRRGGRNRGERGERSERPAQMGGGEGGERQPRPERQPRAETSERPDRAPREAGAEGEGSRNSRRRRGRRGGRPREGGGERGSGGGSEG